MEAYTPVERLDIYEKALELFNRPLIKRERTYEFLCHAVGKVTNNPEFGLSDMRHLFAELYAQRPAQYETDCVWFPIDREGIEARIYCLQNAIREVKKLC